MWLAATLEAIAIPIAPPSCCEVFSSPDASPAWCSATPGERGDRDRDERERGPGAGDEEWSGEVLQEVAVDGHLRGPDHARADQRHPDRHHDLGPAAGDQSAARGRRARSTSARRPATRPRSAARCSASTCCMYSVPTKMNAKKLPPSSNPATFAPASVRSRKIDSGSSGDSTRFSITRNAASSAAAAASSASVLRGAPAVLRRLRDRVDQQHQPAGAGDGPGRVEPPPLDRKPALGNDPRGEQPARSRRSGRSGRRCTATRRSGSEDRRRSARRSRRRRRVRPRSRAPCCARRPRRTCSSRSTGRRAA